MSTSFGLDIGSVQARVVQAEKTSKGYKLKHLAAASVTNEASLTVSTLLKTSGIRLSAEVNLALSEDEIYSRIITVPKLSAMELNSAINYEAEQYVPIPLNEVELFHQILNESDAIETKTMKVMLIAVPKDRLKHLENFLDKCGLIPRSLETELIAIKRVLAEAGRFQLLLLLNHKSTDMIVVHRNDPVLMHSWSSGGMTLTRTLVNEMGLGEMQAEQYKHTYGLREDLMEGKVAQVLLPVFKELINEINKIYIYLNEQGLRKTPDQVILAGGGALLPGLTSFLVKELNTEVIVADPFKNFIKDENFKKFVPMAINPEWTTVVGLAIKDL
jgi:type IV pilus assembly protein PilM